MPPPRIVRLAPDPDRLAEWSRINRFETVAEAVLWFLSRVLGPRRRPQVFYLESDGAVSGYGTVGETELRRAAAYAQGRPFPPDGIRARAFPEHWRPGVQLEFEARLRPVRRNAAPGRIAPELLAEWLAGQLAPGAEAEQVKIGPWRPDRSADFAGRLAVLDPESFRQTLLSGTGRGLRRGYGMIRIKE